ncbi:MAG: UDP-N-acetylmuramoyl-L-alanyl-D-glutamate--2,6-diaminopimelate ligase, partial [Gemmatimonadota bacterium]|nr:UDP-N-acetylmuramoyl-L-alanyl-D-glutamate--2,6-diaminopimelate ligase [Gemmatimonadota bacterium]
ATAVVVEDASRTTLPALVVRDARSAAALAAAAAFGRPADGTRIIGVTGTNGKTTTVDMLRHLLDDPGSRAASIGTLGVLLGSEAEPVPGGGGLTTPGPIELQRLLRGLVDAGVTSVSMEVSSHALQQRRMDGVSFDVAVFTNLSRDHLDYHGTMDAYLEAKGRLADHLRPHGVLVVNADDPAWRSLPSGRRRVTFSGRSVAAEAHAADIRYGPRGSVWTLVLAGERVAVRLPLVGDFNVANALAAAAAAWSMGVSPAHIGERLGTLPQVPGRLEIINDAPTVLRDYAHTPDALERALCAVRPFATGKLIVVFGCGGDRDRGKRPEMGAVAERVADRVIITSDNPRTEDPERILDDIASGLRRGDYERIEDRRQAIARAITIAGPDDVVLLAGKGHETYQVRGTEKLPFDERVVVRELLADGSRT